MEYTFDAKYRDYPPEIYALFPLIFILYRPTKPKPRKKRRFKDWTISPKTGKRGFAWTYEEYKKKSARQRNNYSFVTCLIFSPGDYTSMRRSLCHKGFTKLVGAVYPTDEEIEWEKHSWRLLYNRYHTAMGIYHSRECYDPEFKTICERLDIEYPAKCSGQLHLFRKHEPGYIRAKKPQKHVPFQKRTAPATRYHQLCLFGEDHQVS